MREYTVYFQGKVTVEAASEAEATQEAYDKLAESGELQFNITSTDEGDEVDGGEEE